MMRMRDLLGKLWQRLAWAPHLPIALYLGLTGIAATADGGFTPDSLQVALPLWLTQMWTVCVGVGGILGTVGGLFGAGRVESAGLGLLAYGAGLYGIVIAAVVWPIGLTTSAVCLAVASMCLIRIRVLSLSRSVVRRFDGGADGGA